MHLHSTMYLLKLLGYSFAKGLYIYLHSTMYLLKPSPHKPTVLIAIRFTFHYVSIKTP